MRKTVFHIILLISVLAGLVFVIINQKSEQKLKGYVQIQGYAQGGAYSVTYNQEGLSISKEQVQEEIDAILAKIDFSLSGYNKNSLLSRFNAGETVTPDEYFTDMYDASYRIYEETSGVVDVASAPLFDVWGFGFKTGEMPSDSTVEALRWNSGMGRLYGSISECVSDDGTLAPIDMLLENGPLPQLNYNAVAQGYSCDKVAEYLYSIGVKDMLVNIGEIYCDGLNPSGQQWTVGIDKPVDGNNELGSELQAVFSVPEGPHGVVTSGNYRKFYVKDGRKYAHTIDPRTGYPVVHSLLSATIIAPDAMMADAYATCCMVLGLEESKEFIASHDDVQACLIYDQDGEFKVWYTEGFSIH